MIHFWYKINEADSMFYFERFEQFCDNSISPVRIDGELFFFEPDVCSGSFLRYSPPKSMIGMQDGNR